MAGTVDEGDVTTEVVGDVGDGVDEGVGVGGAAGGVHGVGCAGDGFGRSCGWSVFFAVFVVGQGGGWGGLVDFSVGVAEFDGDVADHFVFEADGLDSGDGFDDGGFAVGYVADGSYIDGGLARDLWIGNGW